MHDLYLSMGSNVGPRQRQLAKAIARLRASGIQIRRVSSVYETEPVGDSAGPRWFCNIALAARTDLGAREVLAVCQAVEESMGRRRMVPGEARNIDIDVLMLGSIVVAEPGCEIPHARMTDRRFVLEPLAEIAPGAVHPPSGLTVGELFARLTDTSRTVRLGPLPLAGEAGAAAAETGGNPSNRRRDLSSPGPGRP